MDGESWQVHEIPGYSHIERLSGSAGSNALFSAVRDSVGDRVAIKVISSSSVTPEAIERFNSERRALQALRDVRGIVGLVDSGTTVTGEPYLVMPLLDRSLDDVLHERGALSQARMALVMSQIASALARAHDVGVLHRDIKPANILLTQEGAPYLADFGIARMISSHSQALPGITATPAYAPPEILLGHEATDRSDVYSLGMTCWATLVGFSPVEGGPDEPLHLLAERVISGDFPRPSAFGISDELSELLLGATAKEPCARPSAIHLAQSLARLVPCHAARWQQTPEGRATAPQTTTSAQSGPPAYVKP